MHNVFVNIRIWPLLGYSVLTDKWFVALFI